MIEFRKIPRKVLEPMIESEIKIINDAIEFRKKNNMALDRDELKETYKHWMNVKIDMEFRSPEQERFIEDNFNRIYPNGI